MGRKSAANEIGQFFNKRRVDERNGAKPELDPWYVTTRQARTLIHMPGKLILQAKNRPILWRGNLYKVID